MEALARINPVSYVIVGLRSLVIDGWVWDKLAVCLGVILALGAVLTALSLRAIATYDRGGHQTAPFRSGGEATIPPGERAPSGSRR